ncbi:unnamed protein product [Oncorhynchus mykiss]|uniref:Ig-like domain-containing protein n=1 Tax=Oncorhynchus mykiss TaxID=8022 RepID=A0A060Z361_ONCMY|nr:unnamed protein product [Oncorhynchus mykiss]
MLFLQDATYDTAGEYVCEVTVSSLPGLHTSGSVHIIVQGAPQMKDADREVEMDEGTGKWVNLSCEAHAHPLPTISWTVTGSQSWREVLTRATEHSTISLVSVKVTSDITAFCNATNDIGTETKSFSIRASKPPCHIHYRNMGISDARVDSLPAVPTVINVGRAGFGS